MKLATVLLVCVTVTVVECRGNGAPSGACDSMVPGHYGMSNSADQPTVSIALGSETYTANQQISVTITANTGKKFKGFLVQPRNKGASDSANTVGTIATAGSTSGKNNCNSKSAVTHTNNDEKTVAEFTWTAPGTDQGTVVIVYTIVEAYSVDYWAKLESAEIRPNFPTATPGTGPTTTTTTTAPGTGPTTTTTTTAPGTGTTTTTSTTASGTTTTVTNSAAGLTGDLTDETCGTERGCFSGSNFLVSWKDNGEDIEFVIKGKPDVNGDGYVAMGISTDQKMGDDSVIGIISIGDRVTAITSYNVDGGKSNDNLDENQFGLQELSCGKIDGVLACKVRRKKTYDEATASASGRRKREAPSDKRFKDMNQDFYILVATGQPAGEYLTHHNQNPTISSEKADFQSVKDLSAAGAHPLIKAHGCLMQAAWLLFAGIGIACAWSMKTEWPESKLCGEKVWFQIHRTLMILVFSATAAAFVLIFVHVGGYSHIHEGSLKKAHPIIGIVVMSLTVINPIMALFRPHPDHGLRWVFNACHGFIGSAAHGLGIFAIFIGVSFDKTNVPEYITYLLYAYVGWIVLQALIFTAIECCCRKKESLKVEDNSFQPTTNNSSQKLTDEDRESQYELKEKGIQSTSERAAWKSQWRTGKMYMFWIHVGITLGLSACIIVVTAIS